METKKHFFLLFHIKINFVWFCNKKKEEKIFPCCVSWMEHFLLCIYENFFRQWLNDFPLLPNDVWIWVMQHLYSCNVRWWWWWLEILCVVWGTTTKNCFTQEILRDRVREWNHLLETSASVASIEFKVQSIIIGLSVSHIMYKQYSHKSYRLALSDEIGNLSSFFVCVWMILMLFYEGGNDESGH